MLEVEAFGKEQVPVEPHGKAAFTVATYIHFVSTSMHRWYGCTHVLDEQKLINWYMDQIRENHSHLNTSRPMQLIIKTMLIFCNHFLLDLRFPFLCSITEDNRDFESLHYNQEEKYDRIIAVWILFSELAYATNAKSQVSELHYLILQIWHTWAHSVCFLAWTLSELLYQ